MRILFIGTSNYDYVQDLTYSGLVKTLGIKNIIENSWNPKYHINYKRYPKNLGFCKNTFITSLLKNRNNVDVFLITSSRPDCIRGYLSIADKIPKKAKVIYIDGGDSSVLGGEIIRLANKNLHEKFFSIRPFDLIFKREYLSGVNYGSNIMPFPISFNMDRLPKRLFSNYKYKVGFWASETHPDRTRAFDILAGKFDCDQNGTLKNKNLKNYKRRGEHYFQELANTKISLNIRGNGHNTLRYLEIPAVGGFMISQPVSIEIPNDFETEKHVVFCNNDLSDLEDLCNYYLKNDDRRMAIAKEGRRHLEAFHTDKVRAKYLLNKISHL